jgi:hypothetical protein
MRFARGWLIFPNPYNLGALNRFHKNPLRLLEKSVMWAEHSGDTLFGARLWNPLPSLRSSRRTAIGNSRT